jgi:hypothetical protein
VKEIKSGNRADQNVTNVKINKFPKNMKNFLKKFGILLFFAVLLTVQNGVAQTNFTLQTKGDPYAAFSNLPQATKQ